ncbi:MAG: hypothetical protein VKJ04_01465 [Vampirovibrionales bacterium]|nr:hypothetical protein [Vampirovibrionales bacterium]
MSHVLPEMMKQIVENVQNAWSACQSRYGWLPFAVLRSAFCCSHRHTPVHEGKCYCPDCGEGIVYRWLTMRCSQCLLKRDIRYRFGHWLPAQPHCVACGETAILEQFLESPKYHQLHKASLIIIRAKDFEKGVYQTLNPFVGVGRSYALCPIPLGS